MLLMNKAKAVFTVLNDRGLHTRPSTELVKCAANFNAQVLLTIKKSSKRQVATRILLLALNGEPKYNRRRRTRSERSGRSPPKTRLHPLPHQITPYS